jgi:hypothetical protein
MADRQPRTYRKTATVKAMQWDGTGDSTRAIIEWAGGKITRKLHNHAIAGLIVHTLEGPLAMDVGDWALQGDAGEFWPNRGDIFDCSYEEIADD